MDNRWGAADPRARIHAVIGKPVEPGPLTCAEAIAVMADYLEAAIGDDLLAALERHLRDCPPCVAYLNTYKRTRTLTGEVGRVEMPDEMKRRLRQALLEHLTGGSS